MHLDLFGSYIILGNPGNGFKIPKVSSLALVLPHYYLDPSFSPQPSVGDYVSFPHGEWGGCAMVEAGLSLCGISCRLNIQMTHEVNIHV